MQNTASEQLQTEVEKHTNNRLQNPMHTKIKRHMQKMLAENKKGIVSGKQKSEKKKKNRMVPNRHAKKKQKNMQTVLWGESKQKIAWRTKKHAKDAQKHANNACK